jgi:tetratricopeptide (TPR) repeat protein
MTSTDPTLPLLRRGRWLWIAVLSLAVVIVFGVWAWLQRGRVSIATLRQDAVQAENSGDLVRTAAIVDQFLVREPDDQEMLLRALRVAVKRDQLQDGVGYLKRFYELTAGERDAAAIDSTMTPAGEAFYHAGYVDAAERSFRYGLEFNLPDLHTAHVRLAFLMSCEGRRWEAVPHLLEQLRQGAVSVDQLLWLGDLQAIVGDETLLKKWTAIDPSAVGPRLGTAIRKLAQHDPVAAAQQLIPLAAADPELVELGIQLGKAALELTQLDNLAENVNALRQRAITDFVHWNALLDVDDEAHPDLWVLRGRWLMLKSDSRGANRCFIEALWRNPDQQYANFQLAQLLQHDSNRLHAKKCVQRAEQLSELYRTINLLYDNRRHVGLMQQAAEQTEALGRLWEAWGWYRMVLTVDPKAEWAWQNSTRLRKRLDIEQSPRVLAAVNPVTGLDRQAYPLPDWRRLGDDIISRLSQSASAASSIQFVDRSHEVGIDFTYFNSPHQGAGERSFEFTGGGVAVLDFDVDGWPDLYFTQGCRWSERPGRVSSPAPPEFLDRLFRNGAGARFTDVTAAGRIVEDRFSQGVTVGDYNSDGFPDLYIANIGSNCFLRNNGDGTFSDVTTDTATAGEFWSTSCVLADVNADSLPDLYVVNYLAGDDVYDRICQDPDFGPRLCYPQVFPAAADLFYLNRGDGTFEESAARCGLRDSNGRGMGIVAADFEGNGRLNLFVANDTTANFYFRNQSERPGDVPAFSEEGISSGLAFDLSGQAQASMGIATADVDRDGRLDLFVTNFEKEYNNLYVQPASGLFTDSIDKSGLKDAGYAMLGFGTQFLDADLDGWPDLFVANGHIDDFTRQGIAFQMPPQFFRNVAGGAFRELPAADLGLYFQGKYLGRAVARLDWNRDGLDELAIGQLGTSSVLLTNNTPGAGRYLSLELRGVVSSRDAIGARVELKIGDRAQHYQLTAGDGYQASNERRLIMGVGNAGQVDQLIISWPGGSRQSFQNVPTNTMWMAIEGRPLLIRQSF